MGFYDGPSIVTNGLVLSLDAADKNSYPGSGTTWTDLTGNSNNGTLSNGPTFNSSNGGSIVLDGSNDYVALPSINTNAAITLNFWANRTSNTTPTLMSGGATNGESNYLQIRTGASSISLVNNNFVELGNFGASTGTNLNAIYNIIIIRPVSGTTFSCYINGEFKNTLTINALYSTFSTSQPALGISTSLAEPYTGRIYSFSYYNRVLSATEILQNYDVQKTRFGL
jgi:hypothetical protein